MSPAKEEADRYYTASTSAKRAAVMVLLMPIKEEWNIVFMKRAVRSGDRHSGQISFPGGGLEEQDETMLSCAIRETQEEIGLAKEKIKVLGNLTKLYVYASNYLVFPYVGYLEKQEEFEIELAEVDKVITAPLSYFSDSIIKKTSFHIQGYNLKNVPYYDLYGEILWGATAMMMSELVHLWKKAE